MIVCQGYRETLSAACEMCTDVPINKDQLQALQIQTFMKTRDNQVLVRVHYIPVRVQRNTDSLSR